MKQKNLKGASSRLMSYFQNNLEILKNHQHSILKGLSLVVLLLLIPLGLSAQCEPDIAAIEDNLPNNVNVNVTAKPGVDSYFIIDVIDNTDFLTGTGIPAWCADQDLDLENGEIHDFSVYSSYGSLPPGAFEKTENFDLVNWLLNQDFIGQEIDGYPGEYYTFGHIQYAMWLLLDDSVCSYCSYLTNPSGDNTLEIEDQPWNNIGEDNVEKAEALAQLALDSGEGFVPGCGELMAIVLIPEDKQSLIITKEVPPLEEECNDCEGKVTELKLQYNGTDAADIVVKTKKEGETSGTKVVFEGNVAAGGMFSFVGNDKKGTLGTEITIYVNGVEHTKIHTSCSQPIGPGLISGDFEVISGSSRNGGELCPVDTPPDDGDCECDGKVNALELQNNGDSGYIVVKTKKEGETSGTKVVFEGDVGAGDTFSFVGNDKKGTLGTEITIYVNGVEHTKIHTSCSQPIGPGLISGDFEVISGTSRNGGLLCPVDNPPDDGDDCECEGGMTEVTFSYSGNLSDLSTNSGSISDNGDGTFTVSDNGEKLEKNLEISSNGSTAEIHTSCSQDILGVTFTGGITVIGYVDTEGSVTSIDTCPVNPDDSDCECDGKVNALELQYNGTDAADIVVKTKKEGKTSGTKVVFEGNVGEGGTFSFVGNDKKGTLGTEITIYVDGSVNTKIHTSCSQPIGPGLISGDFEVISGSSRNGGELCPVNTSYREAARTSGDKDEQPAEISEFSVKAWPNPSDNQFSIKVHSPNLTDKVNIEVFDMRSRVIHKAQFNGNTDYNFGDNFNAGIYFVRIHQTESIKTIKVIKQ